MIANLISRIEKVESEIRQMLADDSIKDKKYKVAKLGEHEELLLPTIMYMFELEGWSIIYESDNDTFSFKKRASNDKGSPFVRRRFGSDDH